MAFSVNKIVPEVDQVDGRSADNEPSELQHRIITKLPEVYMIRDLKNQSRILFIAMLIALTFVIIAASGILICFNQANNACPTGIKMAKSNWVFFCDYECQPAADGSG